MSEFIHPEVIVYVRFLTPAEGGWSSPTPSMFLQCPFAVGDEFFECCLLLAEVGPLSPGESAEVPIKFLRPDLVMPLLSEGTSFKLHAIRTFAVGHVLRVVPPNASGPKFERPKTPDNLRIYDDQLQKLNEKTGKFETLYYQGEPITGWISYESEDEE